MINPQTIHVTHITSGDLWAGAEVQLYTLCKALKEGMSVSVVLFNHGTLEQKLRECNVKVEVLDEKQLNEFQVFWRLYQFIKKQKTNVVHTHRLKENILGGFAAWLSNIPSIRTVHGALEHQLNWLKPHKKLFNILDWFLGRYIQSYIITVSKELKELLSKEYPINKLKIIENGVDIDSLIPYQKQNSFNTHTHKVFKIGIVGRLVPVKRIDLFIETAKYLQNHNPELNVNFHIFGDGPLRSELEQQIKSLDLKEIVYIEGHSNNIHTQIASFDALVIASDHEGLPMTLLEAMAIGTPVVSHAVGGISAACNGVECCWLVNNNSVKKMAQALLECLRNEREREIRTKCAQNRILSLYSAQENAKQYKALYIESISN